MLHLLIIFDSQIGSSKSNTEMIKRALATKRAQNMPEDWKPSFIDPNMKQNPCFFHPIKYLI